MKVNDQALSQELLVGFVTQLDVLLSELFDPDVAFDEKELQSFHF